MMTSHFNIDAMDRFVYIMLAIAAVLSIVGGVTIIRAAKKESDELFRWRNMLRRGEMVRVRGMTDKQQVWKVHEDRVTLRIYELNAIWYKCVPKTDVYPLLEETEYILTDK